MLIRPAVLADAEAIRDIYNPEVLDSTVTFDLRPRTLEEQQQWIVDRSGAHAAIVAVDDDGALVGFGSLSSYKDRAGYSTTVEDSVYVHRGHHGQGIGRALLAELLERARRHGFHAVMARIVRGHEASIALHTRLGFEVVGTEREVGRKFGRWLDVVVMEQILTGDGGPSATPRPPRV
ncbi:MAG TPA: GNAT family N-acetyltransferase [Acidimicrobiales bacterium]|jgi:phosphinothricin acetyltransferase